MGKATREAPAQTELRPTSAGAFRVVLPYDAPPHEFLCQLVDQFVGDDVVGEATREAPARRSFALLWCVSSYRKAC